MPMNYAYTPGRSNFGLLPEPERSPASFLTSMVVNGLIVLIAIFLGNQVKKLVAHKYEETVLIIPTTPPPPPMKIKLPEPPKITPPEPPKIEVKLEQPKIMMPKPEPKPEPKPIQMEAKVNLPTIKAAKPSIVLAPQPKAAMTAAMPAQNNAVKASTAPVHLGDTFGVTPNPNATRPATVAAIGNPYGGLQGPAVAPHGVVGSTGIGNGLKSGSNAGVVGKVASAGVPGGAGTANTGYTGSGKVAQAVVPTMVATATPVQQMTAAPAMTNIEVLSKPPVQYTSEARQLRIQGDVVLRVTFTAAGQVVVQGVTRGLGHGLDEEARRVAQQIRFRPATKNGQAVDATTTITITFQLA
jgi:TonB family protein